MKASHEVEVEGDDTYESEEIFLGHLFWDEVDTITGDFWSVDFDVDSQVTEFKLDYGSKICVVGEKTPWIGQRKVEKSTSQFRGPGRVDLNHLVKGVIRGVEFRIGNRCHKEDLYVMRNQPKNLLSKRAIEALNLLMPDPVVHNMEKTPDFRKEFPKLFTGLGLLKDQYKIPLKDDAISVCIYAPRRVPHPLLPKVKSQLEKMERLKVISKVTEPTEWCCGMVPVPKPSGDVRICVDLTPLNKCVKREVHPMYSVNENKRKYMAARSSPSWMTTQGFGRFLLTSRPDYSLRL